MSDGLLPIHRCLLPEVCRESNMMNWEGMGLRMEDQLGPRPGAGGCLGLNAIWQACA
jgi:hypothetical protein